MQLPIITVPNPRLRVKSVPVDLSDKKVTQFIANLGETLVKKKNPSGVGLSGIQVDHPLRVFYVNLPTGYNGSDAPRDFSHPVLTAFINPTITAVSDTITLGPNPKKPLLEGCLSIPNLYGPVWRHDWIEVEFYSPPFQGGAGGGSSTRNPQPATRNLEKRRERFSGFTARVIQHEQDHLEGILFTDYTLGKLPPPVVDHSPSTTHHPLNLYFDTGDTLEEIPNPQAIITW